MELGEGEVFGLVKKGHGRGTYKRLGEERGCKMELEGGGGGGAGGYDGKRKRDVYVFLKEL